MKKALITGASSGIGRELAERYIRKGYHLYLIARSCHKLQELQKISDSVEIFCHDLQDLKATEQLGEKLKDIDFDLIILNAGVSLGHNSRDFTPIDDFNRLINVNFLSIHSLLHSLIPNLKSGSKVVSISSLASLFTMPSSIAYSSSKRALNSYIEGLRYYLQPCGVEVINILPGFIVTPLTDKNGFKMPFLMGLGEGVDRIERAIESGKREVAFPKRFYYLIKLLTLLPDKFSDSVVNRFRV